MHFQFGSVAIRVNIASQAALIDEARRRFGAGQGFALATINLDHLVKLSRSESFRQSYAAQDLVVADGNPIVWLSRLAGPAVALAPGSDLVLPLAREAAAAGLRVALVGATDPTLAASARRLLGLVPGLQPPLCIAPPMGFDPAGAEARAILAQLAAEGIGLCFVALGAPKQEAFAALGRSLAPDVGFASVGAGLDFLAGSQKRAPLWVRQLALEWLWRAASNPFRLVPRYLACLAILPGQVVAALRQRQV